MSEKATFGAGCFWGIEQAFRKIKGVLSTQVGYSGGSIPQPTYDQVCEGDSGHTEVVEVTFDPSQVTYKELLDVFWNIHDASVECKTQYRSVIFTHSSDQEKEALAEKKGVTSVEPAKAFFRAEEYHQCYLEKKQH